MALHNTVDFSEVFSYNNNNIYNIPTRNLGVDDVVKYRFCWGSYLQSRFDSYSGSVVLRKKI